MFFNDRKEVYHEKIIAEKGFDRTLDEYSDDTRKAKQWLLSDQWIGFYAGMYMLQRYLDDGGHTALILEPSAIEEKYPDTAFAAEWGRISRLDIAPQTDSEKVIKDWMKAYMTKNFNDLILLSGAGSSVYQGYTDAKRWDNGDLCIVDAA